MNKTSKEKVLKAIAKALKLKKPIKEDDSVGTLQEWDSFGHLVVLTALDREFKGRIADIRDMAGADSVKKILAILEREKLI